MKNKLFIIVACFSLMAICSIASADPISITEAVENTAERQKLVTEDTLPSRTTSDAFLNYNPFLIMQTSRVAECGNGIIQQGEACEASADPNGCSEGFTCNDQTCKCEQIPICGDGLFAGNAEQCEATLTGATVTPEMIDRMCVRQSPLTHYVAPWFAPPALAEGSHYVCNDCVCATCGNGIVDPGEECDGTEGCNNECKMAPPVVEKIKCSIKQYGALDEDYINELNSQVHAILGTDQIDLFGQELYSKMVVQVEFPDTVIPTTQPAANIQSSLIKSGDVNMTSTGVVLLGGPVMDRLSTMVDRPRKHISAPLRLFPRGSGAAVNAGQSVVKDLGGQDVTILVPDLSSSFPEVVIESDLSAAGLGETDVTVVSANEAALNGVARFMVVAGTPTKAQGEAVSKQVVFESFTWPAPPGFTGEQEVIEHDPSKVLEKLQAYVNQLKAEGREDEIGCDIAMKLDVPWEPQMFTRAAIISDTVKINSAGQAELANQQVQNAGYYSLMPISAAGGRGVSPCSLTGGTASGPQIMLTLSMLAVAITGIGVVRRRKR